MAQLKRPPLPTGKTEGLSRLGPVDRSKPMWDSQPESARKYDEAASRKYGSPSTGGVLRKSINPDEVHIQAPVGIQPHEVQPSSADLTGRAEESVRRMRAAGPEGALPTADEAKSFVGGLGSLAGTGGRMLRGDPTAGQELLEGVRAPMRENRRKAQEALDAGENSKSRGYEIASRLPVIGAIGTDVGEEYATGNPWKATRKLATAVAPFLGGSRALRGAESAGDAAQAARKTTLEFGAPSYKDRLRNIKTENNARTNAHEFGAPKPTPELQWHPEKPVQATPDSVLRRRIDKLERGQTQRWIDGGVPARKAVDNWNAKRTSRMERELSGYGPRPKPGLEDVGAKPAAPQPPAAGPKGLETGQRRWEETLDEPIQGQKPPPIEPTPPRGPRPDQSKEFDMGKYTRKPSPEQVRQKEFQDWAQARSDELRKDPNSAHDKWSPNQMSAAEHGHNYYLDENRNPPKGKFDLQGSRRDKFKKPNVDREDFKLKPQPPRKPADAVLRDRVPPPERRLEEDKRWGMQRRREHGVRDQRDESSSASESYTPDNRVGDRREELQRWGDDNWDDGGDRRGSSEFKLKPRPGKGPDFNGSRKDRRTENIGNQDYGPNEWAVKEGEQRSSAKYKSPRDPDDGRPRQERRQLDDRRTVRSRGPNRTGRERENRYGIPRRLDINERRRSESGFKLPPKKEPTPRIERRQDGDQREVGSTGPRREGEYQRTSGPPRRQHDRAKPRKGPIDRRTEDLRTDDGEEDLYGDFGEYSNKRKGKDDRRPLHPGRPFKSPDY